MEVKRNLTEFTNKWCSTPYFVRSTYFCALTFLICANNFFFNSCLLVSIFILTDWSNLLACFVICCESVGPDFSVSKSLAFLSNSLFILRDRCKMCYIWVLLFHEILFFAITQKCEIYYRYIYFIVTYEQLNWADMHILEKCQTVLEEVSIGINFIDT